MAYIKVQKGDTCRSVSFPNYSRRQLRNRLDNALSSHVDLTLKDSDGDQYQFDSEFIYEADLITIGGQDK